ncbi:histidinol-phosphatase [Prosthecobacter vanneervenii]|uniref:histidinol-phosphatase n=1 Tax=Prosthecobacter vanneervenii TaxID=48466 RepID=A0A7W7YCE5_9BACT|nr:HisJ family histidinol phosphate phosphatase [Prosthecobacter vanneervenii]
MSKSKPTKKKAAQGKARPAAPKSKKAVVAQKKAKPAPAKKVVTKSKPAKKPAPAAKKPLKKPVPAKASVKKPAAKPAPAKKTKPAPKPSKAVKAAAAKKPAAKPAPPAKKPVVPAKKAAPAPVKAPPSAPVKAVAPVKAAPAPAKAAPPPAAVKAPAPAKVAAPAKPAVAPVVSAAPAPVVMTAPAQAVEAPARKVISLPLPPPGPTKSGALFYDSHMHTPLCKHAWGEPEEYAEQALKAGLKGIIFTCHCPMPNGFWPTVRMSESEFDTYLGLVQRAADTFKGRLDVRLGIESEYFPGYEDYISKLHQRADFHYVLGAVHWQAKEYLNKFETGTIENFRRIYFDHLAKSAETGLYDCLAHPDLVKNYHPDSWCFAIVKNTVATALDRIAATGVAMELNTSGLNKSYSEMNPGVEMLRMISERGIPVVLGSDSHRANRVGEHFVTALNNLTEAGFEKVSYFLNRQRIDLKISDVLASLKKAADHNA